MPPYERAQFGPANPAVCPNPLDKLITRIRAGDQQAARALWEQFSKRLLCCIRGYFLPPRHLLQRDLDAGDLAQETWLSMFEILRRGRSFADERDFIRFLFAVAGNRFRKHYRARVTAGKRSLRREVPFDLRRHDRPAPGPGPAELAAAAEERRLMLARLSRNQRVIVLAVLQGERLAAAAERLGVNLRKVQRILQRLRQRQRPT